MQRPHYLSRDVKANFVGRLWIYGSLVFGISLLLLFAGGPMVVWSRSNVTQTVPPVTVQRWSKPQSGWIYVLDSNDMRDTSQVLLVNPAQASVVGTIQAGYAPDIALSIDGKRLYVASGAPGVISVIDTETGYIIQQFPVADRLVQLVSPAIPIMTISPNGRWLAVMEMTGGPPAAVTYSVAVFDTLNNNVPVGQAPINGCGVGRLVWTSDSKSLVHCPLTNDVTLLTLDAAGQASATPLMSLPEARAPVGAASAGLPMHGGRIAYVAVLPDGENAMFFTPFGEVSEVNLLTQRTSTKVTAKPDSWLPFRDWPHSSDGKKIYVGIGTLASRSTVGPGEINVFDTSAGLYTGAIKTSVPFWSLVLSNDNRYLYAVSRSNRKILVLDTQTNKEIGVIENMGGAPSLAIVAP
jgi:DNA-binding beta-propeller fold protein YncE